MIFILICCRFRLPNLDANNWLEFYGGGQMFAIKIKKEKKKRKRNHCVVCSKTDLKFCILGFTSAG